MSTVITSNIVISKQVSTENEGLICYQNQLVADGITSTSELSTAPITNVVNPATAFKWEAEDSADQTITATLTGLEIDYIGIASHNLNQVGLTVTIKLNGVTVSALNSIGDNQSILFVLNTASPTTVEIVIAGATTAPRIGVISVGKAMKLQRKIYVGHTPMTYGRNRQVINGISESGQYLGEVVTSETKETTVSLQNLTPDWYRSTLDPFFALKPRSPCFFAWRPASYPDEVSYCWISGNPSVSNQRSNGMMQASFKLVGIA